VSHRSSRSERIKAEARNRPDVIWHDQQGGHEEYTEAQKVPQSNVLAGGTELAQLVAEADAHMAAMRKIVQ
jgi:hypothetical protein